MMREEATILRDDGDRHRHLRSYPEARPELMEMVTQRKVAPKVDLGCCAQMLCQMRGPGTDMPGMNGVDEYLPYLP
jgi:hypothetical protein